MGLIYVNPEGPGGVPDALQSARDIKVTFERMAMNHEETVALTAGGHTFGKAHGAGDPSLVDVAPEAANIALQGLGWASAHGSGFGEHTITSGIEGAWVNTPTEWSENYFRLLLDYEYELVRSPAGAKQWQPINQKPEDMAPAAHDFVEARADDDDDRRYGAQGGSGVPRDLREIPKRPRSLQGRIRARLVQAHPSRHGPQGSLPRAGSAWTRI